VVNGSRQESPSYRTTRFQPVSHRHRAGLDVNAADEKREARQLMKESVEVLCGWCGTYSPAFQQVAPCASWDEIQGEYAEFRVAASR
jgi:hypothetical protein